MHWYEVIQKGAGEFDLVSVNQTNDIPLVIASNIAVLLGVLLGFLGCLAFIIAIY